MMRGIDLRVAGRVRARAVTGLWGLALGLGAAVGCTPETAMESMHSTDALPTEVARVTDAGTRAVRTLATLRGAPVRAEAAHSTAPTVMAHDRADEGILVRDERSGVGVLIRVAGARAVLMLSLFVWLGSDRADWGSDVLGSGG